MNLVSDLWLKSEMSSSGSFSFLLESAKAHLVDKVFQIEKSLDLDFYCSIGTVKLSDEPAHDLYICLHEHFKISQVSLQFIYGTKFCLQLLFFLYRNRFTIYRGSWSLQERWNFTSVNTKVVILFSSVGRWNHQPPLWTSSVLPSTPAQ